ncbi:PREDICTED: lipase member I [Propithecus coquereli]|uniref:lipase member I n=1 Tax=Propithecus coquereli TaxID=379532 RepID=UPI00063FB586|nr:PREDICTED: lipase member I [Propithecus coquereli]
MRVYVFLCLMCWVRSDNRRPCLEFSQLNVKDSFRDLFNPRIEIILMMYTRNNLNCAEPLFEHNNSLNINFNTQKKTIWLIHGYRPMGSTPSWLQNFLRILLNEEDVNIIVVDWNRGATTFIYNRAVKNTRKVAENLSGHIKNLLVVSRKNANGLETGKGNQNIPPLCRYNIALKEKEEVFLNLDTCTPKET